MCYENRTINSLPTTVALRNFHPAYTGLGHFPALPHRSIAVRFTPVNGHRPVEVRLDWSAS